MNKEQLERNDNSRQDKDSQERPLDEHNDPGRRNYSEDHAKWDTIIQNTDPPPPPPPTEKK